MEVLVPYIEKGLEQNEFCVWVTSEMSEEEARAILIAEILNIQEYIDTGQLQLVSSNDWFLPETGSNSKCILDNCLEKCQEALYSGYSGLRITGNVSMISDWDSLMDYENLLNCAIPAYKALVVCTYRGSKRTIDNIADVMNTHRYVICKTDDSWGVRRGSE